MMVAVFYIAYGLTGSYKMLKKGQTYFQDLAVWTTQKFSSMFDHFSNYFQKSKLKAEQLFIFFSRSGI